MEKSYTPESIEQKWYQHWEQQHYFKPSDNGTPYCIMIPPPNVTGSLHMGHGFQHSLMDTLIRYHRMQGFATLWQVGSDHAGIATQMVVERLLNQEGTNKDALGREAFVQRIWQWKQQSGDTITQQMRRLGNSVDWSRERFTMDPTLSRAVTEVFVKLYEENLIYRGKRLVNWDPVLLTAISDLEVLVEERIGKLWHIRYPIVDSNEFIIVATTRPETLLGDTAVAVHPDDSRYQHLIGKMVKLPIANRHIPIIADEFVDPQFGSGCVKITPAHDFNDYDVGKRHELPMINIFTATAHLNENAPVTYQGLERFVARDKILTELEALQLLHKTEDYALKIPKGDRSDAVIEPWLTDQWYVKVAHLRDAAVQVVENGDIQFVPDNWKKTYFQWMHNLQDWCISRQLWWGHRVPVWYDDNGKEYVGLDEAHVREKYKLATDVTLTQDSDVLDTWFSSALWPFSTLGWPENTADLQRFYPTDVLLTGFDIIFFWVARMIMFGLKFTGKIPFKTVYITGLIRDAQGQKMSKSKGNIIDPLDLIDGIDLEKLVAKRTRGLMQPAMAKQIEKTTRQQFPEGIPAFGTDALRFTFCALATPGREIRFDLGRLAGYRNFCNKIWNAARFVLMNTEGKDNTITDTATLSLADRWIQARLQQTIQQCHEYFAQYRFDLLTQTLHEFTWHEFCDWYLEFAKPTLNNDSDHAAQRATRNTLLTVLETLLRLLHPIMPFITEEIWQRVKPLLAITAPTIMLCEYPQAVQKLITPEVLEQVELLKSIIYSIRNSRSELNIPPSKTLTVYVRCFDKPSFQFEAQQELLLKSLAKISELHCLTQMQESPADCLTSLLSTPLLGSVELHIAMAGVIDKAETAARTKKELEKVEREFAQLSTKVENKQFMTSAPKDVIDKVLARLNEVHDQKVKLSERYATWKQYIE